jgi:hypothetical protein
MRTAVAALALLMGCSASAQACRYTLYIYQPLDGGAEIYAVAGGGRSAAMAVRGCGDANLLPNPDQVVSRMQALQQADQIDVITVAGPGSRTSLGSCVREAHDAEWYDGQDNLIVVEDASPAQMRYTLGTLEAAPRALREQWITDAGLRACRAAR